MSAYIDKELTCKECGKTFVWTADEQEFYASKNFLNEPARCPECRAAKKQRMGDRHRGHHEPFPIVCAQCGKEDTVPFKPTDGRPVLCGDCFAKQKEAAKAEHAAAPAESKEEAVEETPEVAKPEEQAVTSVEEQVYE